MRLGQLHRYLEELMRHGVDEDILVCVPGRDGVPAETDRVIFASGAFSEDASPAYAGFVQRNGQVMVLTSGPEHPEALASSHQLTLPEPAVPGKIWPGGDWRKK